MREAKPRILSVRNAQIALWVTRGACILAGFFIAVVPALDDLITTAYRVLLIVPPLFAVVVAGLYFATDRGTSLHRSALVGAGIGVVVMIAPVALALGSSLLSVVAIFVLGVPAVVGFTVFVLFVAYLLWTASGLSVPRWIPVALVVVPVVDPILNAVLISILPIGISVTGLTWVTTGLVLHRDSNTDHDAVGVA